MAGPSVLYQAGTHASRPANGSGCVLYSCTDHDLVYRDDGTSWTTFMTLVGGSGGDIATDTIWDAAGDLVQGTGANTGAKLTAGVAGNFLRSAGAAAANAWAFPPGHEYDYVEITSGVSIATTSTTIVTGSAVTYDGSTPVVIEFFSDAVHPPAAAGTPNMSIYLFDNGSTLGRIAYIQHAVNAVEYNPVIAKIRLTPSAAAHTYSIRAQVNTGTGTVSAGTGASGSSAPAYIRITKAN